jgi:hypothetical protein
MEPFKDLSHLKLNPDQKDELRQINEAREKGPDKKTSGSTENLMRFCGNRFGTRPVKITIDKAAQKGARIFDDYHKMKK